MKTITTLFATLILMVMGTHTAKASQLYLRTHKGGPMTLRISGLVIPSQHGDFGAVNLPAGYHYFTIHKNRGRGNGHHRNRNRGRNQLFSGGIHIPPRSTVVARVTHRGELVVESVLRHAPRRKVRRAPAPRSPRYGYPSDRGRNLSYGMSMDLLMQQMDQLSFESQRKDAAMRFFDQGDYTSEDVLAITNRFHQEKNKLDLAKYAYDRVLDPENYLVVQNTFGFYHSREVLADYLI